MMGFLGRALWGFAALALCQVLIQAQTVPLTGDAYFLPGSAGNAGAAATVSVGGTQGYLGLFQFDLHRPDLSVELERPTLEVIAGYR